MVVLQTLELIEFSGCRPKSSCQLCMAASGPTGPPETTATGTPPPVRRWPSSHNQATGCISISIPAYAPRAFLSTDWLLSPGQPDLVDTRHRVYVAQEGGKGGGGEREGGEREETMQRACFA